MKKKFFDLGSYHFLFCDFGNFGNLNCEKTQKIRERHGGVGGVQLGAFQILVSPGGEKLKKLRSGMVG